MYLVEELQTGFLSNFCSRSQVDIAHYTAYNSNNHSDQNHHCLQNSNLVLTAEQRTSVGKEPDGSAETLWGNMAGKMGDRVQRSRPEELDALAKSKNKKRTTERGEADIPRKRRVS